MLETATTRALLIALVGTISFAAHARADVQKIEIPPGELMTALASLARQANVELVYLDRDVKGVRTKGVNGTFSAQEAVTRLLEGTPLIVRTDSSGAILIAPPAPKSTATASSGGTAFSPEMPSGSWWSRLRLAQADASSPQQAASPAQPQTTVELEEVIVTGTNIRGSGPIGSPVVIIDRNEIEVSGYGTAQQLLETLPQNFRGTATEDSTVANGALNVTRSAGVNLRGLGESSTLVLLNGRRLASGGGLTASFVDISMIPLSAVQQVQVLTDGASAIYGSDAVAGVVNFILRDDYSGAETRARYGAVTSGGLDEIQLGQTWGQAWSRGHVIAAYEYFRRTNLDSAERSFASNSDLRPLGGSRFGATTSNPGNITSPQPRGIPGGQDGTSLTPGDLLPAQNLYNTRTGVDLFPQQTRHSILLAGEATLTSSIELFGEVTYVERDFISRNGGQAMSSIEVSNTHPYFVTPVPGASSIRLSYRFTDDFGPQAYSGTARDAAAGAGLRLALPHDWQAELSASYALSESDSFVQSVNSPNLREALGFDNPATPFNPAVDGYFNIFADGSNTPRNVLDFVGDGYARTDVSADVRTVRGQLDGALFSTPAGDVRAAFGVEVRAETLDRATASRVGQSEVVSAVSGVDLDRDLRAAFVEFRLPIVGAGNAIPAIDRLEVSLAGRYEEYSDFGDTTNPKIGLHWSPLAGLAVRGSYGTSFRAPNFHDLAPTLQFYNVTSLVDTTPENGPTLALLLQGNNPDMGPEKSRSWTAGLDFAPPSMAGLSIGATYFEIAYEDRIGTIGNAFDALRRPDLFAPVIVLDPDDNLVASLLAAPYLSGPTASPAAIAAIVDGRSRNLAQTDVSGIDASFSFRSDTPLGMLDLRLNANYFLEYTQAVAPTAPTFDIRDTLGGPVDLRVRARAGLTHGAMQVAAMVNYADDYADGASNPHRSIGSWTTLDLHCSYSPTGRGNGYRAALTVQNVFDKDPPFVNNSAGLAYDPRNATPLGRFFALEFSKQW